jgi:K+-dependent Na+/Ca+ exchanger-like protein
MRRKERLPQTMAVSVGLFVCLACIQASTGAFDGWNSALATASRSSSVAGGEALPVVSLGGRQMSVTTTPTVTLASQVSCPVTANASSLLPSLGFEDQRAASTIFMILIMCYMFLGLAIVCDSFFEAALSAICEAQNLKDDVAGATWMAAGGSAPELATSILGVFISQSDVGFGTIVGSAVFNVLFVIACCAFVAPNLKLTWWPLARDASYYCFALAMIVIFVSDDLQVHVWEASFLLVMYAGYVTVMAFNERLEAWVTSRIEANKKPGNALQTILKNAFEHPMFAISLYAIIAANSVFVILEIMEFDRRAAQLPCVCGINVGASVLPNTWYYSVNLAFNIVFIVEMLVKMYAYGFFGYWGIPLNCFDGSLVFLIVVEFILTTTANAQAQANADDPLADANNSIGVGVARLFRLLKFVRFIRMARLARFARLFQGKASTVTPAGDTSTADAEAGKAPGEAPEKLAKEGEEAAEEEEEDDDDDGPFNPFEPWGDFSSPGGLFGRTMWFIGLPLSVGMWATIPDCRREMFAKYWFFTFLNCIIWIGLLATVMGWMAERLGVMYNVPPSIMGIFVLAAGTSIPDCLSSVAVARRGHGDMAVSSSIGSNIFDVLIGLPIPWFIYGAIYRPARGPEIGPQWVQVQSEALAVMILLLFVMVALVVTTIHLSGWILSVRLGAAMMGLYGCFLVLALCLDRKVIFPDCIP